jgi:hypothetical protein
MHVDLVSNGINALVVGVVGLLLAWLGKGQFEAVGARFEAIETRIDRLEERLEARMDTFQSSLDGMRSDLTQVALAVGARPRATNP